MTRTYFIALPLVMLAACNSEPAGKSTAKLDAIEVQPGTISDSMIILDDSAGDGTAIDNSVPDDGTKKEAAKPEDASTSEEDNEATSDDPEAIAAPGGQKAVTPDAVAKKAE
ncbi:hypothetical protein [Sphingopyxis sp.]|uniref:hypothetical protein n=1 Tax=Sphingopyxis sp. TaxID=1908224 RepID=UPI003BAB3D57